MPRYYQPTVQDRSGEILAQSLVSAFDRYRGGKRQQELDAEREQAQAEQRQATDLSLAMQGIRRGPAPMEAVVPMPKMEGGRIVGVTSAPERFTQLTDAFYRDNQVVREQQAQSREAALADALFKARVPMLADPEGYQTDRDYKRALTAQARAQASAATTRTEAPVKLDTVTTEEGVFTFNPVTGERGNRLGARPRPQSGGSGGNDARTFTQSMRLADQYRNDPTVKNAGTIAENFEKIRGVARNPSAAGDISLVFSYMKMLDPGSTVREGEFATAQNAAGVPERVRNAYNKAQSGEFLSPAQRADFLRQAAGIAEAQRRLVQGVAARYRTTAQRFGVDPEGIIYDPFDVSLGAQSAAPQQPVAPVAGGLLVPADSAKAQNPYRRGR